jgi:hypothetical protein
MPTSRGLVEHVARRAEDSTPYLSDHNLAFPFSLASCILCRMTRFFTAAVLSLFGTLATFATPSPVETSSSADDPFLWLENVTGEKALQWVREQNAVSTRELEAQPDFAKIRDRIFPF